ncbi:protein TsetseEP-like [Episyrphus balteatus]|uniref:protein TsetseEP-like n=1 Tax=Episyrphus balteatus TaxID=286459 RepID=UPI002485F5CC|nr:protein TsetseEP-like [Episyrphus balteatus]
MKLICSILILAGVFALNDASEIQMRIARDMSTIQDLMRVDNKAQTACSTSYLAALTEIMNVFNTAEAGCSDAAENKIKELNDAAVAKLTQFSEKVSGECDSLKTCTEEEVASDGLNCYATKGLDSSKTLSSISTEAASAQIQLNSDIDNVRGIEKVCSQNAYAKYLADSEAAEAEFEACRQGKTPAPAPAPAPTDAPTPAPETEAPAPAPEQEQEEQENRGRSFVRRPNRFNRF